MTTNPYAAPKATVAEATAIGKGDYVAGGQGVEAGRGWAWIAEGWELYKRRWGLWIGIILLMLAIFFGLGLIPFLGSLAAMLLWPVFIGGLMVGCRTLDEGGELEVGHLFAGFRERTGALLGIGGFYLGAMLVAILVVMLVAGAGVGMAMMGGGGDAASGAVGILTVLLAVLIMFALLLPVTMATWFAPALVVFHDLGVVDALKASFAGCWKNLVPFLVYGLLLMAFAFLASLPLLLGWLVLGPVISASLYTSYRDIYLKPRA